MRSQPRLGSLGTGIRCAQLLMWADLVVLLAGCPYTAVSLRGLICKIRFEVRMNGSGEQSWEGG